MYFLRVDYIYRGCHLQRERTVVSSYAKARDFLSRFDGEDYLVLVVRFDRFERCC